MITFEEAKKIALESNKRVNACREYEKAFLFFEKNSDSDGDGGVVVMKSNGKTKHFIQFILDDDPETNPKNVPFGMKVRK